ncbi:hypothetical protein XELAEV_18017910mg [Xenopus laevis]|uniref:Uncharacterized protein n=1 Tax=Xenopus laevis TaxID=8355 RepID=A0A974DC02_XENLA|nr:hypothetical protein XELAEV_18017910mg [Xenopus laevis]
MSTSLALWKGNNPMCINTSKLKCTVFVLQAGSWTGNVLHRNIYSILLQISSISFVYMAHVSLPIPYALLIVTFLHKP